MSRLLVVWLIVYFGGLLLAVVHPMYPLISYLTFYYLPPHLNWWGRFLPDLRYSLLASLVLLVSVLVFRGNQEPLKDERNPALPWLLLFGLNTLLVSMWAIDRARNWVFTVAMLKLILLYVLLPAAVRTPMHFEVFGAAHVAGASYWGYKAWDQPRRSAGRLEQVGGPDTQSDNQAAGHLLTVIPFAVLLVLTVKRKVPRASAAIGLGFILNVFILCNSRGAMLGFVTGGLSAIMLAGKGRRSRLLGLGVLGLLAMLYLADPEFIARQQTTVAPTDNSAQSRLVFWRAGLEMVRDHPLGSGGRAFHILSPEYIPEVLEATNSVERSGHNTYTQLATEWGVQGTVLYLGFMVATFILLRRIRKRTPDNSWYFYRSLAIEVGLIGTLTAAMFSNRLYGESIYWLCSLAFALYRIQTTELAGDAVPVAQAQSRSGAPPLPAFAGGWRPLSQRQGRT